MLVCVDGEEVRLLVDGKNTEATAYKMDGNGMYHQIECRLARVNNRTVADLHDFMQETDEKALRRIRRTRLRDLAWAVEWGYLSLPEAIHQHLLDSDFNLDNIDVNKLIPVCIAAIKLFLVGTPNAPLAQDLWPDVITASRVMSWFNLFEFAKFDVLGVKE